MRFCTSRRRRGGVSGPIRRADAVVVVNATSVTVLGLVGGGGGDAVTATTARTPLFLCEERSGHSKAPQPCGTVVPSLSRPPLGGGLRYQVKGGPKRRAPESGERATCAGDVALRLQTNHSKQRFAAETAHLSPAALHSFGRQQWRRCGSGRGARTSC